MGKNEHQMNSIESNDNSLKESSNDSNDSIERTNGLSVQERDYMIKRSMTVLKIEDRWKPVVAKAANYVKGPRFWELVEYSQKAKSKAHCFIKCLNNEMYR